MENHTLAFLLVLAAGASTCIGAAVVYHPTYIQVAKKRTLGSALGISAGVMLYVSFIEIFGKSQSSFEDSGMNDANAYLFATLCFFGGFVLMIVLDKIVHKLDPDDTGHDLDFDMLNVVMESPEESHNEDTPAVEISAIVTCENNESSVLGKEAIEDDGTDEETGKTFSLRKEKLLEKSQQKLQRMGLVTALAIGIHNFPEGLATFVATLDDPAVGAALAVAIAIHNIPEGVCVAMPIFFASGDRHRAFFWACVSGASEVAAAALGWVVLSHVVGDIVYAVLFGVVSGMMVNICAYQLIPTAHKYDPKDTVVSHSIFFGMVVMAISLVAFLY